MEKLFDNNKLKFDDSASEKFKDDVKKILNKLAESETGKSILKALNNSTSPITFVESVADEQGQFFTGFNSETQEISLRAIQYSEGFFPYQTTVETIAHELIHGLQLEKGLLEDGGKAGINIAHEVTSFLYAEMVLSQLTDNDGNRLYGASLQRNGNSTVTLFEEVASGEEELTLNIFNDFIDNFEDIYNPSNTSDPYQDPNYYYQEHIDEEMLEKIKDLINNL